MSRKWNYEKIWSCSTTKNFDFLGIFVAKHLNELPKIMKCDFLEILVAKHLNDFPEIMEILGISNRDL